MAWETLVALSCLENPGIYLHTDDDTFLVMDHVEAQIVAADNQNRTRTIRIKNPTPYDARVAIFAESSAMAKRPLGWGAYDRWPRVAVKAGDTVTVDVREDAAGIHCEQGI